MGNPIILIYAPKSSARLRYVIKFIFTEVIPLAYEFTSDKEVFIAAKDYVKINYSPTRFSDKEIIICQHELLFQKGIIEHDISFIPFHDTVGFFTRYSKISDFPFDIFAATFYLVSRYEEYLPHIKDKYGRFDPKESIAYKHHFLRKPIVDIWCKQLLGLIQAKYPGFKSPQKQFKYVPTYDIDSAYAYKYKGPIRNLSGYFKALWAFDIAEIIYRTKVFTGRKNDPFDTYQIQFDIQKKYNLRPIYFILFSKYNKYDRNLPTHNKHFRSLIQLLGDYAKVGIHPSVHSNDDVKILRNEIRDLSEVLRTEITKSRQHFLKMSLPDTYRNLIQYDITDDYSMGYACELGFRAGTCSPFYFYDIDLEVETPLKVHPFCVMDGTLRDYMNISSYNAMKFIQPLVDEVKQVNGTFISLWHNETLSGKKRWAGWLKVYFDMVKYIKEH